MLSRSLWIRFGIVLTLFTAASGASAGDTDWLTAAPGTASQASGGHLPAGPLAPVRQVVVIRPPQNEADQPIVYPHSVAQPAYREPYPYGYFGAKPHHHPYRQFGSRRAYTQWRWQ